MSPGAAATTSAQAQRDITTGQTAMYFYVNASLGIMRQIGQGNGQEIGFTVVAAKDPKKARIPIGPSLWGITSKNNVAAAKKFLAYLATPANNSGYNKISGGLSTSALVTGRLPAGNEAIAGRVRKGGLLEPWWQYWPNAAASAFYAREFQAWFTGQAPSDGSRMLRGLDYLWSNTNATTPPN
jgi:ABC-type glycerol-3-phosphate transport system substrate-binding protein